MNSSFSLRCSSYILNETVSLMAFRPASMDTTTSCTSLAISSTLDFDAFLDKAVATDSLLALQLNRLSTSYFETLFDTYCFNISTWARQSFVPRKACLRDSSIWAMRDCNSSEDCSVKIACRDADMAGHCFCSYPASSRSHRSQHLCWGFPCSYRGSSLTMLSLSLPVKTGFYLLDLGERV